MVLSNASGGSLAAQIRHDIQRLAIVPQLGSWEHAQRSRSEGPKKYKQERVQRSRSEGPKKFKSDGYADGNSHKTLKLLRDQIWACCKTIPVRTALLGNQAGVAILNSLAELKAAVLRARGSLLPQIAITDRKYELEEDEKVASTA
eukprot:6485283-Amphidinium_carterae.2